MTIIKRERNAYKINASYDKLVLTTDYRKWNPDSTKTLGKQCPTLTSLKFNKKVRNQGNTVIYRDPFGRFIRASFSGFIGTENYLTLTFAPSLDKYFYLDEMKTILNFPFFNKFRFYPTNVEVAFDFHNLPLSYLLPMVRGAVYLPDSKLCFFCDKPKLQSKSPFGLDPSYTSYQGDRTSFQSKVYMKDNRYVRAEIAVGRNQLLKRVINQATDLSKDMSWIFNRFGFYKLNKDLFIKSYPEEFNLASRIGATGPKYVELQCKKRYPEKKFNKSIFMPFNGCNERAILALSEWQREFSEGEKMIG